MTLRNKTVSGIIWNFAEQIARRGIGIAISLILAWLLTPADFGLVAMMAVFLAVANSLMDSGFKHALIRLEKAAQLDFNTAFYANVALGLVSYALLFFAAPFLASFYAETKLIILIRVAALNILFHSFQVVQSAVLSRELNFKAQLQATIPAGIISGLIAVGLAYAGLGVWALIAQILVASLTNTVLLWYLQGWRPTFCFSWQSLRSMYNFGYKLFLSGLLDTVFRNLYVIVIAKLFTASIAGYYFFSNKLTDLVLSQLVGSIQNVTYPSLARMQTDDKRLKAGYRKVIQVATFILFPAMLLLAALAEPLFKVFLTEKWLPAVPYFQLICIAGVMHPLHSVNLNILNVKGRSDLFLYLEILKKIMMVGILTVSFKYGVIGILIGQIISTVLGYIPNSYFSKKLISYPIREQSADFMPGLALSAAVALLVYCVGHFIQWPALAELVVLGLAAGAVYLGIAYVLQLKSYLLVREILIEKIGGRIG